MAEEPHAEGTTAARPAHGGLTWKKFVLELPVESTSAQTRPYVAPLDDPAGVLAANAFQFLFRGGHLAPSDQRELGRALPSTATPETALAFLSAFAAIGLGHLSFEKESRSRYRFASADLILAAEHTRAPTCHFALGFVEGVVERLTGKPALGAEVTCRSMGHESCTFHVSLRD